jgi:ABC-2 type transport system permease protein
MKALRFAWALCSTALQESASRRGAFLLQVLFMALNNVLFFSTWWLLFARFETIRGYRLPDMLLLFGFSATGFGLGAALCGGALVLARTIADGDLDAFMAQPKSVLLRAVASTSQASGWGDVGSGIVLVWLSGHDNYGAIVVAILLSAVGYVASWAALSSAAFWVGRMDGVIRPLIDFVITFTTYPPTLFGFWLKVVLFTVLPAGIIAYLPVELVRDPGLHTLLPAVLSVAAYALFASWLFARGLRRYESGSRFGVLG